MYDKQKELEAAHSLYSSSLRRESKGFSRENDVKDFAFWNSVAADDTVVPLCSTAPLRARLVKEYEQ